MPHTYKIIIYSCRASSDQRMQRRDEHRVQYKQVIISG